MDRTPVKSNKAKQRDAVASRRLSINIPENLKQSEVDTWVRQNLVSADDMKAAIVLLLTHCGFVSPD